jgi:uncharacterized membrane protein YphA (DoxX/SURF4 family)
MSLRRNKTVQSVALLLARIVAGGALLAAGILKLKGDPLAFALAMQSFDLFPAWSIPPLAYSRTSSRCSRSCWA